MSIWVLLLAFQLKHFLADYPLQGRYMLGKFKPGRDFVLPLAAHASVHALFTLAIVLVAKPSLWWLALVDGAIHFVVDRVKASPQLLGRFKALSGDDYRKMEKSVDAMSNASSAEVQAWAKQSRARLRDNKLFWWALGADQAAHHLTHYAIIWAVVS